VHAAFALAPNGMNARFAFEEYILTSGGVSIRMVADAETGRPVLITMTGGRDILFGEEMNRYALARAYVNVLGYGDISDLTGGNSYGTSVITEKFDVRGVPFGISVTVSPAAGILSYRLTNSGE